MIITSVHETRRTPEHVSIMEMNSATQSARNSTRKWRFYNNHQKKKGKKKKEMEDESVSQKTLTKHISATNMTL